MAITELYVKKCVCDICGMEVPEEDLEHGAHEGFRYSLGQITFSVWYGGDYVIKDVCPKCHVELMTLLFKAKMLHNAQKVKVGK